MEVSQEFYSSEPALTTIRSTASHGGSPKHLSYQPQNGPWFGFNWRYESGMAGCEVPLAPAGAAYLTASRTSEHEFRICSAFPEYEGMFLTER